MRERRLLQSSVLGAVAILLAALAAGAGAALSETVVGTNGPDLLRGGSRGDKLYGRGGDDRLFGLGGNDLLVGGPGKDLLVGGAGNDRIGARDGVRDTVRCGPGRDTAVVDARDRVRSCESVLRPPPPSTFVLAGAGDIAGSGSGDDETAALLDRIDPDVVVTTGDNAYPDGTSDEFRRHYEPTWGRHRSRTRPSPGNHDYHTPGAAGYFDYFGARAPGPYYSYDLGNWHLISLNSEIPMSKGSPQYQWLEQDLARSSAPCTLAYWHRPRFTASKHDDAESTTPLWRLLYAERAELVLTGHNHVYERYRPMDPAGRADPTRGIREFVVGSGGRSLYPLKPDPRREAAHAEAYGVLELTLRPNGYTWRFVPVSGSYTDSGSDSCRE